MQTSDPALAQRSQRKLRFDNPDVFRAALAQLANHSRGGPIGLRPTPRNLARRFAKAYDDLVRGRTDLRQIRSPVLCLAGEGGEAHCQVDNLALPNAAIFDWLDQVLAGSAEPMTDGAIP